MSKSVPSSRFRPRITATLSVRNWARAVAFYKAAFGATELYRVEGGGVAQLAVSDAEFWVAEESPPNLNFSPESLGGCSVRMLLIVEDPRAVCERRRSGRTLADGRHRAENYWMRGASLVVAFLVCTATPAATQEPVDTTLTIQGFLQRDNEVDVWTIVVPLPVQVLGTRTYVMPVVGKPARWGRYVNRYIEASGRVTRLPERGNPGIGMEVERAKELEPPGTARSSVDHGLTFHADIMLSVVPNRFAWRDSAGGSTGVNPMLVYTILNRRSAPIFFVLPSNRFLCIAVKSSEGIRVWDSTTLVPSPDARRFTMQRGGLFRDAIHFPEDAATRPGHYFAHVGICDVDDYDITAEFDVR